MSETGVSETGVSAPRRPDADFWSHRRVAVTGATGFLGSHMVDELVGLGADVVILRRDVVAPTALTAGWWSRVDVVEGDLTDQALCERLLGDYEVRTVVHLAAQSQVGAANRNPVATFEANITGTWSLLEAARRSPTVAQVVIASSDKAYGDQATLPYTEDAPLAAVHPYDVSKACADQIAVCYARVFGVPVSITRCGNFFGPGDTNWARIVPGTIRSVLAGERPVIRSTGRLTRDYIYARDGVLAYLLLAEAMADDPSLAGEAFNFSLEEPVSVLDLVALIQQAAGTDLEPDVQGVASHEIEHQWLSAARARDRLGWAPAWTLAGAMAETVEWYRRHLGA